MKNYKAASVSGIISIVVTVVITIFSEVSSGFKSLLTKISGHHWLTKGIIALVLFFILYFAFGKMKTKDSDIFKYTKAVFWITIVCSLIIIGFFVFEFFSVTFK